MFSGQTSKQPAYTNMNDVREIAIREKTPIVNVNESKLIYQNTTASPLCTHTDAPSDEEVTVTRLMPNGEIVKVTGTYEKVIAFMLSMQ